MEFHVINDQKYSILINRCETLDDANLMPENNNILYYVIRPKFFTKFTLHDTICAQNNWRIFFKSNHANVDTHNSMLILCTKIDWQCAYMNPHVFPFTTSIRGRRLLKSKKPKAIFAIHYYYISDSWQRWLLHHALHWHSLQRGAMLKWLTTEFMNLRYIMLCIIFFFFRKTTTEIAIMKLRFEFQ